MAGVGNLACGTGSKERQEACVCVCVTIACYLPNRAWTKSWTKFREDREQKGAQKCTERINAIALIQEYSDEDGNKSEDGEKDKQEGEPHQAIQMDQDAILLPRK